MEIVQGIILKTSPYSETQKIIRIYTKEKGYLSMISPSVVFKRKTKTVHLLQISEIEFFENEKSDLHQTPSNLSDHQPARVIFRYFQDEYPFVVGRNSEPDFKK